MEEALPATWAERAVAQFARFALAALGVALVAVAVVAVGRTDDRAVRPPAPAVTTTIFLPIPTVAGPLGGLLPDR